MTREIFTPSPLYTIATAGPYPITHPYQVDTEIACTVFQGATIVDLVNGVDFTVAPSSSETTGDVTLSAAAFATYTAASLMIRRKSVADQGWAGQTARESGLEAQLDALTQRLQEIDEAVARAIKLPEDVAPDLPLSTPGMTLGFDANNKLYAGTALSTPSIISSFAATLLDDLDAKTSRETLGNFDTVSDVKLNTTLTTANTPVGTIVYAQGFRYKAVASGGDIQNSSIPPVQFKLTEETGMLAGLGAAVDGVTDDGPKFAAAQVTGGVIDLGEGDYHITTPQTITGNGVVIRGAGRGRTRLILDCAGQPGLTLSGASFCSISDLTIQGNDVTAPLVQVGAVGKNTSSNSFSRVRFVGNSEGPQPANTSTAHFGVRGVNPSSGFANYFHRFNDCDFDSLYGAFHNDWNANAWQISNIKIQRVWRCFKGGFQETLVSNVFWHFSIGVATDYVTFLELSNPTGQIAAYNQFVNIMAEPGGFSQLLSLDTNTISNYIQGDHQCTQQGTDAGTGNTVHRTVIGRSITSSGGIKNSFDGDVIFGSVGGSGDLYMFGNGSVSMTGSPRKLKIFSGGAGETRLIEIYGVPGGNGVIERVAAGDLELKTTASANQTLRLTGIPTYADNAAALLGGLSAGAVYHTPVGALMIVV